MASPSLLLHYPATPLMPGKPRKTVEVPRRGGFPSPGIMSPMAAHAAAEVIGPSESLMGLRGPLGHGSWGGSQSIWANLGPLTVSWLVRPVQSLPALKRDTAQGHALQGEDDVSFAGLAAWGAGLLAQLEEKKGTRATLGL